MYSKATKEKCNKQRNEIPFNTETRTTGRGDEEKPKRKSERAQSDSSQSPTDRVRGTSSCSCCPASHKLLYVLEVQHHPPAQKKARGTVIQRTYKEQHTYIHAWVFKYLNTSVTLKHVTYSRHLHQYQCSYWHRWCVGCPVAPPHPLRLQLPTQQQQRQVNCEQCQHLHQYRQRLTTRTDIHYATCLLRGYKVRIYKQQRAH